MYPQVKPEQRARWGDVTIFALSEPTGKAFFASDLITDTQRAKTVQEPTGQSKQIFSWNDIKFINQLFQGSGGHGTEL